MGQPFIVTAELPPDVLRWADGLRRAHFPPERNHLVAHVTLFHAFAPSLKAELRAELARIAKENSPPKAVQDGLMNMGRGTALAIHSPAMLAIWHDLGERFHGSLTAQDSHTPRLHITIQNKVDPKVARALQEDLAPNLKPRKFAFTGLGLHIYQGPHWDLVNIWRFRGSDRG